MDTNQVTADATVALAVVGGLALVSNAVIAGFTLMAARATRRSAEATEKAAEATRDEADATREEAAATKQMILEVQTDRDLDWRPYFRLGGTSYSNSLDSQDQINWRNVGRGPALNVVCARLYYVKADLGGVSHDVPQWHLSTGMAVIEANGEEVMNLGRPPRDRPVPMVIFEVLPPGQMNLSLFFQTIVGRRAYRLCPPRAELDVWTPGDKVEPWVSWYFGHLGLQVPT